MPLLKHKRAHKSEVGPSIIVKRIQDEDTFADFCHYNGYEQWAKVRFVAFSPTLFEQTEYCYQV